jgi:hypothetical protein
MDARVTLRSSYFADWGGKPSVLLWGDSAGMKALRDFLRSIRSVPGSATMSEFCEATDGKPITVTMIAGRRGTGMRLSREGLQWTLRQEAADDFAEMVEVLVSSAHGHQYLDDLADPDAITVIVSKDEYPAQFPLNAPR